MALLPKARWSTYLRPLLLSLLLLFVLPTVGVAEEVWTLWQLQFSLDEIEVIGRYPSYYECAVARIAAMRNFPLWHPITDAELRSHRVVSSNGTWVSWFCARTHPPLRQTECPDSAPRLTRESEGVMRCAE